MSHVEKLKEKHAEELRTAERLDAAQAALTLPAHLLCAHKDHVSAMYRHRDGYRGIEQAAALEAARALYAAGPVIECARIRNGCLSTMPADMRKASERDTLEGRHVAEIRMEGGKGFGPNAELRWWTETGRERVHVSVELSPHAKGMPYVSQISGHYDRNGNACGFAWRLVGAPAGCPVVRWGSGAPDSYSWSVFFEKDADLLAWLDSVSAPAVRP